MTEEQQNTNYENQHKSNDEIDLIELALKIWADRRIIYKTVAVFFVLGLIVAFGSKKEYKSDTSFILEDQSGGSRMSGLLSQFGGLAGINVNPGDAEGIISPQLFSNVVKSTPFMLEVLYSEIKIEKFDTTTTIFHYLNELEKPSLVGYMKKFTIGLPGTLLKWVKGEEYQVEAEPDRKQADPDILKLTKAEEKTIENLQERIQLNLDDETGIINLSAELPDPLAAAQLARLVYNDLMNYLINYKIEKAQEDYQFIQERYEEARKNYIQAQKNLARFRDENRNVTSAYFQTEEQRLQNEYQLSFNVYNGLAQQLEQKKIEVQEKTPVFKVVNKVKVPIEKSKPKKSLVMIITLFLGLFIGLFLITVLMIYNNVKVNFTNYEEK
ncbi:MAG: hypothetical protein GVY19_03860 [Bacteroidetes bacterium]|jgi:uncharacterized protein involved in exopolysaccharide biosynthesis|nr:hypothetical protein [Bacteroidota bacterium]